MLALAQRHLGARALHAAHHHLRHITAVPVPRFLRFRVEKTNKQTNKKEKQCIDQEVEAAESSVWCCRKTDVHDSSLAAR